ncbi:putative tail tape measure chaperone protein [Enterococcus phage Phi_Eg_SY1]|nr:putative tail tape measure chaperone protein [Enterococcus phage Phi_Eg_SY1]
MIKLELQVKGKKQTFVTEKVSVRTMREVLAYYTKMEKAEKGDLQISELEMIDELIELILTIFSNTKLTYDILVDNVAFEDLLPLVESVFNQVGGGDSEKGK